MRVPEGGSPALGIRHTVTNQPSASATPKDTQRSLRVLWALTSTDWGGAPEQLLRVLPLMAPRGVEVHVGGSQQGALFPELAAAANGSVHADLSRVGPGSLLGLLGYCRQRDIDLVHTFGKGAGLTGRVAALLGRRRVVHSFRGYSSLRFTGWREPLYRSLEGWLARRSHRLVAVSQSEADAIAQAGIVSRENIEVIPNGIDMETIRSQALSAGEARRQLGLPPSGLIVGTLARPDPVKNLAEFVEIAAQVHRRRRAVTFAVVGVDRAATDRATGGESERALQESGVRWIAPLAHASRFLRAFDVYLSTSLSEGLPNAPMEATSLGIPVLLSDVQGNRDAVDEGRTGWLYPLGVPAEARRRILAIEPGQRIDSERAGSFLSRYSLPTQAAALARLYRSAARGSSPHPAQTGVPDDLRRTASRPTSNTTNAR